MGMAAPISWTPDMVRALPDDGNRYEVVDGELLVTPSPTWTHQRAVLRLATLIDGYVQKLPLDVMVAPADIELDAHGLVQPDVYVQGFVDGRHARAWNAGAPLYLVVEVLSPSTALVDRTTKRRRYQRAGIPEYWIVDTDARVIERWRPQDMRPEVLADTIDWQPPSAAAPLVIDLPLLFSRVHGESI